VFNSPQLIWFEADDVSVNPSDLSSPFTTFDQAFKALGSCLSSNPNPPCTSPAVIHFELELSRKDGLMNGDRLWWDRQDDKRGPEYLSSPLPMRSMDECQPFFLALHLLTLTKRGKYVNIYEGLQSLAKLSDF